MALTPRIEPGAPIGVPGALTQTRARPANGARADHEVVLRAAHELRNPVAAVAAIASTLERRSLLDDAQLDEVVALLGRVSEHMRELITRILDTVDVAERAPRLVPIDVADVVREIAATVPRPDRVVFVLDVQPDLPAVADPLHLRQVLINLLANAYRHGGDHVIVTARAGRTGAATVQIVDDGPGLPADLARRLGQPVTREGDETIDRERDSDRERDADEGMGLGLSISFELAAGFAALSYSRVDGWTVFALDFEPVAT